MTLIDDVRAHYKEESFPPDGPDLDMIYVDGKWVTKDTETEQVSREVIDTTSRWGNRIEIIYKRDDEYVSVQDVEPATEYQDWGDYGEPTIQAVRPVTKTIQVTTYEPLTDSD